jgi:hypothetical protein
MSTTDYIEAAEKLLADDWYYNRLDSDPNIDIASQLSDTLSKMNDLGYIDNNTFEYLNPTEQTNIKPGRLYLQPKLHKPDYRPIIYVNGHFTERTSECLDHHMGSFVSPHTYRTLPTI